MSALFIDDIELRQVPGPATRIDLGGIQFSAAPESYPTTWAPHLCVMIRCGSEETGNAALEVVFEIDGEQVARNAQPVQIEPGRFGYRLVRAEVPCDAPTTIEARCRLDMGPVLIVPFTLLPLTGS